MNALVPTGAEAVPDSRGLNLYRADPALARLAALYLPPDLFAHLAPHLACRPPRRCAGRMPGKVRAYALLRILTPLLKFRACRAARKVAGDAMEVRGGCGYIEE